MQLVVARGHLLYGLLPDLLMVVEALATDLDPAVLDEPLRLHAPSALGAADGAFLLGGGLGLGAVVAHVPAAVLDAAVPAHVLAADDAELFLLVDVRGERDLDAHGVALQGRAGGGGEDARAGASPPGARAADHPAAIRTDDVRRHAQDPFALVLAFDRTAGTARIRFTRPLKRARRLRHF